MTTHTLNGFSVLIPDIPEGATVYRVHQLKTAWLLTDITQIPLPEGDWQLYRLSEVPESLAVEMVHKFKSSRGTSYYPEYPLERVQGNKRTKAGFDTAHASLTSLVRAQGVTENNPYLLIKKD